jgi:hypothetical protein
MDRLMRMRTTVPLLAILILSALDVSAGDGGTLRFDPEGRGSQPNFWPLVSLPSQRPRTAEMQLGGSGPESVWVFQYPSIQFVFSRGDSKQLFVDLDGNGQCDPGELHNPSESTPYNRNYRNLPLPVRLGNAVLILRADAQTYGDISWFYVERCLSCFQGELEIAGQRWPAQLEFRAIYSVAGDPQAIIVLDANRDGVFDPFNDPWLADRGVGLWQGRLVTVETLYSETEARVSIVPYEGPSGVLAIEGEGFDRMHLISTRGQSAYWICIDGIEDSTCLLPQGTHTIDLIWLNPGLDSMKGQVCQWDSNLSQGPRAIHIDSSHVESLRAGGPLTHTVQVSPRGMSGKVNLDYGDCATHRALPTLWFTRILPGEIPGPTLPASKFSIEKGPFFRPANSNMAEDRPAGLPCECPTWQWGLFKPGWRDRRTSLSRTGPPSSPFSRSAPDYTSWLWRLSVYSIAITAGRGAAIPWLAIWLWRRASWAFFFYS